MSEVTEPIVPAVAQEQQGDPEALGEPGKRALASERAARDAAEKSAADLQTRLDALEAEKLTELEKAQKAAETATSRASELEANIAARDLLILKQRVGAELKVPAALIDRLQGDTEEAIRVDAKALADLTPDNSPFPKADPSQGAKASHAGGTNADRFASFLGEKLT